MNVAQEVMKALRLLITRICAEWIPRLRGNGTFVALESRGSWCSIRFNLLN